VYDLSRIALPTYSPTLFAEGRTDFPSEMLHKAASASLAKLAPAVSEMYQRFMISTFDQEMIMAKMVTDGLSAMQAACAWIRNEQNMLMISRWRPMQATKCTAGHLIRSDATTKCEPCPAGQISSGGSVLECNECAAGTCDWPSLATAWPCTA
jgi:hypothetical protein